MLYDNFGLTVNIQKTKVMHQRGPHVPNLVSTITIKGQKLQAMGQFNYLGSSLFQAVTSFKKLTVE